jgi:hypothetical protein
VALRPEQYLAGRHTARFHVQVEILAVAGPDRTPGDAAVTARVVRVFRGDLAVGDEIRYAEAVIRAEDWEPPNIERVPIGGTIWKEYDAVHRAKYAEAFLNGTPPVLEVALWQSWLIDAPTDAPRMSGYHPPPPRKPSRGFWQALDRWFGP